MEGNIAIYKLTFQQLKTYVGLLLDLEPSKILQNTSKFSYNMKQKISAAKA